MSLTIKNLDPESPGLATRAAQGLDTNTLIALINDAATQAGSAAAHRAAEIANKISGDMLKRVEERLAGIEAPKPKIMAVEIGGEVRRLKAAACASLPRLLINAKTGINSLLVGPAGCGKTYAAHQLAEALGLKFGHVCFTAGASETWLFGRQTPNGFIEGTFSRLYREGGVFLGDELDAADANMLLAVNTALANGSLFNPINGETYQKHADFVFVGCANTVGKGSDHVYTGRSRLDGATLNRFAGGMIQVDYDSEVERQLCPDADLYNALKKARDKLKELRSDEILSTRTFDNAFKLVSAGVDPIEVFQSITLGWPESLIEQTGLDRFSRKSPRQAESKQVEASPETLPKDPVKAKIAENEARITALKAKLAGGQS